MEIITKHIADLMPYAANARTHSPDQVAQIAASIQEFGWTNPVLIDEAGGIIAGHGRILAARELGMDDIPCIVLAGLTEVQKRAYILADNKLALNAGWDEDLLTLELGALKDLDFDLELTGFDVAELTTVFGDEPQNEPAKEKDFNYQETYAVVVTCTSEGHQRQTYDDLVGRGYECKVLVN